MPNHVTSEIRIIGTEERVAQFFEQAKVEVDGEVHDFSFRGFVPPPDHPDYDSGGCSHRHPSPGMAEFVKRQFGIDMDPSHPLLVEAMQPEEHPNCWYVWNRENWGTKWDSYDVKIGSPHTILDRLARAGEDVVEEVVRFDTAWAPPFPVFEKIVQLYTDCRFVFRWIDEDMRGSGGGFVEFKDGKFGEIVDGINDPDHPETGKLWWSLARDLKDYTEEQHEDYLAEVAEDERLAADPLGLRHGLSGERSASE